MGWMHYGNGYVKSSIRIAKLVVVVSSCVQGFTEKPVLHVDTLWSGHVARAAESETVRWVVRFDIWKNYRFVYYNITRD